MILQALQQLARNEDLVGDLDYEPKPVAWAVCLRRDGSFVSIEDLRYDVNEGSKRKPKLQGKSIDVPRQPIRTSGDLAFLLVDKPEYSLGIDPNGTRLEEKVRHRADLFRERAEECADASGDEAVRAVVAFLNELSRDRSCVVRAAAEKGVAANELVAFRVGAGDTYVHLRPAVVQHWKHSRQQPSDDDLPERQCLVTGESFREIGLFPLLKRVPGGTSSGVSLVSYNARAFESYGLSGNENAPISRSAAEEAATALNRLLHPAYPDPHESGQTLKPRHVRLGADTVVCFWSPSKAQAVQDFFDDLPPLLEAQSEDDVRERYRSPWHGKSVALDDPATFYALTLTGTQGRAIVRDWLETSLTNINTNLVNHFHDLEIVRHARPKQGSLHPPAVPLRWLLRSLAPESRQGRPEAVPGALQASFIRAALGGGPYPVQMLQRVLVRARVETGRDDWTDKARSDARAAIIKAVLNRRRRFDPKAHSRYQEIRPTMNANYESPGYALGMLMAVLERLQAAALGDINASVVDRFFSAASAAPRNVFVRLLRNAKHHARKAGDSDKAGDRVIGFRCERLIDQIADRFDVDLRRYPPSRNGLPSHLDLEQQGLFVLGYHQMRHWLWMNNEERSKWEAEHPDAPRAFRWLNQPPEESPAAEETTRV